MEPVLVMSYYLELRDQVARACNGPAAALPALNADAEKLRPEVQEPAKQQATEEAAARCGGRTSILCPESRLGI
jgi:hypothetical protein